MGWIRYFYQPSIQLLSLGLLALGGIWIWIVPATIFFLTTFIDVLSPDYEDAVQPGSHSDALLFATAALALLLAATFVVMVSHSVSASGFAAFPASAFGPEPPWALAGGALGVGMLIAAAFNVGHELSHRRDSRFRLLIGQVMCALSLHACFPIEHVYGHHKNVGTSADPTTARRGESFWSFLPRSFLGTYRNAFRIARLRSRRHDGVGRVLNNRAIHGIAIQLAIFFSAFLIGGGPGLAGLLAASLVALLIVELFQYVGHYGLVRVPGTPVRAAHAWELSGMGSSSFTINLTCHSAHHLSAGEPFWALRWTHQAPALPLGPFPVLALALFPPLFFRLTAPALEAWDRTLATPGERALIRAQTGAGDRGRSGPDPRAARPEPDKHGGIRLDDGWT